MRLTGLSSVFAVVAACVCSTAALAAPVPPTEAERAALERLRGAIDGQIIWESNRSGTWQLYAMNADGTNPRQLTQGDAACTEARFSADGKRVVYTRKLGDGAPEVWIMNNEGRYARRLIANASSPNWRKGDTVVEFQRQPDRGKNEWQTWHYDLATGQERLVFPLPGVAYSMEIWGGTGNDEATRFVAWSPNPRGTWVVAADGGVQAHVHGGCEGQVSYDQRYGYGVEHAGSFIRFSLSDGGDPRIFNDLTGPYSHSYFPYVAPGGQWLIYGACPPDQHDQDTSDYEIFLVGLDDWKTVGEPVRLTFDDRTDRWPVLHVRPDMTPPAIKDVMAGGNPAAIVITFSEPVDSGTAQRASAYTVSGGTRVRAARLLGDGRTVVLAADGLKDKTSYTLTIGGVRDLASKPNLIAAGTKKSFVFDASLKRVTDGLQALYTFEEGKGSVIKDRSGVGRGLDLVIEQGAPVRWIPHGVEITGPTLIATTGPAPRLAEACRRSNEITIEAWLEPASADQDGPSRIVTLSADPGQRNFTLGQAGSSYDVRLRTTATSENGTPSVATVRGLLKPELTQVVYTRTSAGDARIFLNGRLIARGQVAGDFSGWGDDFRLGLANELSQDRPWAGEIRLVAIYSRALRDAEVTANYLAGLGLFALAAR